MLSCDLLDGAPRTTQQRDALADDLRQYVARVLETRPAMVNRLAPDLPPQVFIEKIIAKSQDNFLFVGELLSLLALSEEQISEESLQQLPATLYDTYSAFLERITGQDRDKYLSVLGLLAVAAEKLPESKVSVFLDINVQETRRCLNDLRQYLSTDDAIPANQRRYSIYHRSFAEYLTDAQGNDRFWCDPSAYHQRVADHYPPATLDLWDEYGLRYAGLHRAEAITQWNPDDVARRHTLTEQLVGVHQGWLRHSAAVKRTAREGRRAEWTE